MKVIVAPFLAVAIALRFCSRVTRLYWRRMSAVVAACVAVVIGVALVGTLQRPPVVSVQRGYRGTGMYQVFSPRAVRAAAAFNTVEAPLTAVALAGKPASAVYKNVQVLKNVDAAEFLRLMGAMTEWVAPTTGCAFCHSVQNMASDALYQKRVARRMIQMVQDINSHFQSHVENVGVTCGTCHRGEAKPQAEWFITPINKGVSGFAETATGQNRPAPQAGLTALPNDPFTAFLLQAKPIRVSGTTALPSGNRTSINQADWTYALMIHFSDSLGVNCVFCHDTRDLPSWSQSTPQRVVAWHAIPMVRYLNLAYLAPLHDTFPAALRGVLGDAPKVNCMTCHNGAYKPFYGATTLSSYPELTHSTAQP